METTVRISIKITRNVGNSLNILYRGTQKGIRYNDHIVIIMTANKS